MDVGTQGRSRRALVLVAVRNYPGALDAFTSGIDEQLRAVESWWCDPSLGERAFDPHHVTPLATRRDVEDAVHTIGLRDLTPSDVAVVYVTGHGCRCPSGRHYLLLPATARDRILATGYPTADLVTAVLDSHAEHVLVIVNSCFAGALHAELARQCQGLGPDRRKLTSLTVYTVGDFDERPTVREFTELLRRVRDWLPKAGYAAPFLSVDDFEKELIDAASREPGVRLLEPQRVWPTRRSPTPSPCLPNPAYQQPDDVVAASRRQVADSATELDYWLDRASGRVSADDPGWYFTGRRELTGTVAEFLRSGDGVLLVTGAAGTGKSAVIARAVTLSDPGLRADPRYQQAVATAPAETVPPIGSVDAAVLARNKNVDEVAAQLLTGLGATPRVATPGHARIEVLRGQLREQLLADDRRRTLVLDGLDEARQPSLLVADLLGPLARLADDRGRRLVRLVIGVRSTSPGPGTDDSGQELLDLLRRSVTPRELIERRTDGPGTRDDIAAYVEALLTGSPSPYEADDAARRKISALVAEQVTPSFLDARLAGRRLREADTQVQLDDPSWLASLGEGTLGLLRSDLQDAATATRYPAAELLAVLRAAAYAQGAGIPWAEIWPAVAAAVLDRPLPDADGAIAEVLGGRLSGYLARDVADGRTVYRPAHERLAQVLRGDPSRILNRHQPRDTP